jgi:hypothetical protein
MPQPARATGVGRGDEARRQTQLVHTSTEGGSAGLHGVGTVFEQVLLAAVRAHHTSGARGGLDDHNIKTSTHQRMGTREAS